MPEAFLTAYRGLFLEGGLAPGQWALVRGATSGVGLAALQLIHALGARSIATSRSQERLDEMAARFKAQGMPQAYDRGLVDGDEGVSEAVQAQAGGAHLVLDFVGASVLSDNLASLRPEGRQVQIGILSGAVYFATAELVLRIFKVDDVLNAFAVHAAGGLWGLLAAALFLTARCRRNGLSRLRRWIWRRSRWPRARRRWSTSPPTPRRRRCSRTRTSRTWRATSRTRSIRSMGARAQLRPQLPPPARRRRRRAAAARGRGGGRPLSEEEARAPSDDRTEGEGRGGRQGEGALTPVTALRRHPAAATRWRR